MSTEEHLKILKCLVDTGVDVLRNLSEIHLLDNQRKSLFQFLEDERHFFYHQYEQKYSCCECSTPGCTMIGTGKMSSHIFNKVYYFDANRRKKYHFVQKDLHNAQRCICAFNPRNITLDNLDLSDLYYFLRTKGGLSSKEISSMKVLMETKNSICDPSSTNSIGLLEVDKMVVTLENAILDLSQPVRYKNMIKMYIQSQKMEMEKMLYAENQTKETVKDEVTKKRKDLVDQTNISHTLELPSISKEEQSNIVEKFTTELQVGFEDENIRNEAKQIKSIVFDNTDVASEVRVQDDTLGLDSIYLNKNVLDPEGITSRALALSAFSGKQETHVTIHKEKEMSMPIPAHVRTRDNIIMYNQITLRNMVFQAGDSGTCIYGKCLKSGKTGCIGMLIGKSTSGQYIVTPMKDILNALGVKNLL